MARKTTKERPPAEDALKAGSAVGSLPEWTTPLQALVLSYGTRTGHRDFSSRRPSRYRHRHSAPRRGRKRPPVPLYHTAAPFFWLQHLRPAVNGAGDQRQQSFPDAAGPPVNGTNHFSGKAKRRGRGSNMSCRSPEESVPCL